MEEEKKPQRGRKPQDNGLKERVETLEKDIQRLTAFVLRFCHEKGADNLPKLYNYSPYVPNRNDMTKWRG